MNYEEKIEAIKKFLDDIDMELFAVETSGGALIVAKDIDTKEEIGYRNL